MKIACSFFYTDDRYKHLADVAIKSFKTWHPDIDVFIFDKNNIDSEMVYDYSAGYCKFYYASTLFDKGYTKVISLGVDTITCSRLTEMINSSEDVLVSLDFNHSHIFNNVVINSHEWFNADVICFNNKNLIDDILTLMRDITISKFFEQGLLCQILKVQPNKYTHKVLDVEDNTGVYNGRLFYYDENYSKSFHQNYPYPLRIENNELVSPLNKKIKVIHMVEGFGVSNKDVFINKVNLCKVGMFNDETKSYFINNCGIEQEWFNNLMTDDDYPKDLNLYEHRVASGFPSGRKLKIDDGAEIFNHLLEKFSLSV